MSNCDHAISNPAESRPLRRLKMWQALLLTAPLVWAGWLYLMISGDRWEIFRENWFMSVTMVMGSFIAGATSEGGGAVAFPVMTLLFNIEPAVARNFSFMIQSVGMTAAAATILLLRIRVDLRAVLFGSIGGTIGIIIGITQIAPYMSPPYVKMFFTSLWLSFGLTLFWLNRHPERQVYDQIPEFRLRHALLLISIGVPGGIVSGMTGSGLDIMTFTMLTLLFRVNEKIATPTSVILMGVNTVVGFAWVNGVQGAIQHDAWNYWYACVPIVVVGAPMGAWFITTRNRHFVAGILYFSIVAQFLGSLFIIPQNPALLCFSASTLVTGILIFSLMSKIGASRMSRVENRATQGMVSEPTA